LVLAAVEERYQREYLQANLWIVWCFLVVLESKFMFCFNPSIELADNPSLKMSLVFTKFSLFWLIFATFSQKILCFLRNFRFFFFAKFPLIWIIFTYFAKFLHTFSQNLPLLFLVIFLHYFSAKWFFLFAGTPLLRILKVITPVPLSSSTVSPLHNKSFHIFKSAYKTFKRWQFH